MHTTPGGLWGLPKLLRTRNAFVLAVTAFVVLLFALPPEGFISPELGGTILTITTFLLGIIIGFFTYVTSTDYVHVKDLIANENAGWISLHRSVSIYHVEAAPPLADAIDTYVRRTLDYEIMDYPRYTIAEFDAAATVIRTLPFKPDASSIHQVILGELDAITLARQQLFILGSKSLSVFSWLVLFALAGLVTTSLYGLRTGEWFFDLITVLIGSAIVLLLLLIRDLDSYIWNEGTFGFEAETQLLHAIGKLPYFPAEAIASGRVRPGDAEYRVGIFTNFPRSLARRIEVRHSGRRQPTRAPSTRTRRKAPSR